MVFSLYDERPKMRRSWRKHDHYDKAEHTLLMSQIDVSGVKNIEDEVKP